MFTSACLSRWELDLLLVGPLKTGISPKSLLFLPDFSLADMRRWALGRAVVSRIQVATGGVGHDANPKGPGFAMGEDLERREDGDGDVREIDRKKSSTEPAR